MTHKLGDGDLLRQLGVALTDATPPWQARLSWLRDVGLPRLPILLLLDNAEDLLIPAGPDAGADVDADQAARWKVRDGQLAEFLATWVRLDSTRLVVTSRYPFTLPGRAERRLARHHLGPLSPAETRKLLWRLPALDALTSPQRRRAYTDLGGHPRSLEYLDALLAGGAARFDDVADRIEAALDDRGITDPDSWLAGVRGDLDQALAETVTLTADDVLLPTLLAAIDAVPLARDLLLGAAVYPDPVDEIGLAWQVATEHEPTPDPERDRRLTATAALIRRVNGGELTAEDAGLTSEVLAQHDVDWADVRRPPLDIPAGFDQAFDALLRAGLLSPAASSDGAPGPPADAITGEVDGPRCVVHRWTAAALADRTPADQLAAAHRRAARYRHWRVAVWPQDRVADIHDLVQARSHHHAAGDTEDGLDATDTVVIHLQRWGAWTWEEDLLHDTLAWPSIDTRARSQLTHELGIIAQLRGDYARAEQRYQASLTIFEELGDRAGIGRCYHQLGMIAQLRGDYAQAEQRYQDSLTIDEELGDRAGIAISYHQLGWIAQLRGDYALAEQRYQDSLTIREEVGDRAGIGRSYHQLGMIAELRGDYGQAEQRYQAALAILDELGDRAGIAASYHQLGMIAELRGDYGQAEQRYQAALTIDEELGDRAGIATSTSQLGVLHTGRGDPTEAVAYNLTALSIRFDIGSPDVSIDLYWLARQQRDIGEDAFRQILDSHLDPDSVTAVLDLIAQVAPDDE